jgi:hypothetical protein
MSARTGLHRRAVNNCHGFRILKNSCRVVLQAVTQGSIVPQERRHFVRSPEEPRGHIDQMCAEFKHVTANELAPFRAPTWLYQRVDLSTHKVHLTEPSLPHRVDDRVHSGVIAPHITGLQK